MGRYAIVVEIKGAGSGLDQSVALNTKLMPLSGLRTFLGGILEQRPDKHVFIKPSRDKTYGDVIAAMDETKGAGANPLLLLIDEVEVPRGITPPAARPPVVWSDTLPGRVPGGVPGGAHDETPTLIRKSSGALQGSATRRVDPATPPRARAARVSGAVVVEVIVDEAGNVISAVPLSGHPLLRDAAVEAARGWKFELTELSGVPVRVIGTLTFNFD